MVIAGSHSSGMFTVRANLDGEAGAGRIPSTFARYWSMLWGRSKGLPLLLTLNDLNAL